MIPLNILHLQYAIFGAMDFRINQVKEQIAPLRERLTAHPVYGNVGTLDHLRLFMQHHVFAVWDFMSLLKTLQRSLTCVNVPWVPVGSAETRYLINEIVCGEESDVDPFGKRTSHFELYCQAMQQAGADTHPIDAVIQSLTTGATVEAALNSAGNVPSAAKTFTGHTFSVIASGKTHVQAAVFTFGREDLIPGMFLTFVQQLSCRNNDNLSLLKYYLERHIEVDGGHHAHLGYDMTARLCGDEPGKWDEATEAVKQSLLSRLALWDAINLQIAAPRD